MGSKWLGNAKDTLVRTLSFKAKPHAKLVREMSSSLYMQGEEHMPAVGGCVDLHCQHSEHLLPAEVLLFEPGEEELFAGGAGGGHTNRLIFLNTPLTDAENAALGKLHEILEATSKKAGTNDGGKFPDFVALQMLRMLQYRKFDTRKTVDLIVTHLVERVKRLPITEASVMSDLRSGFMYWHGRDKKCRPCLVIRIEHMGDMKMDKERAVKLVIFVLEYAIRYAMVPGRAENWVVLLDLANASKVVSMLHLASLAATGKAIATTLESVYCGRMVWMKILNMPSWTRKVVESLIPAEKKKKVQFETPGPDMLQHFEPNQLEKRYGGTAPDLEPIETYPFHFFPGCRGSASSSLPTQSMHEYTTRKFHEGTLWDNSSEQVREEWLELAQSMPLTKEAALHLQRIGGTPVKACEDMERWRELAYVEPEAPETQVEEEPARLETVHEQDEVTSPVSPAAVELALSSPVLPPPPGADKPASLANPIYPMRLSI